MLADSGAVVTVTAGEKLLRPPLAQVVRMRYWVVSVWLTVAVVPVANGMLE